MSILLKNGPSANTAARQAGYSAPYLYILEEDRPILRSMSTYSMRKLDSVEKAITSGFGQGRDDEYQPWIRIRRNFSSPTSYQVYEHVAINARNHHFLSKLEFDCALLNAFLGATELRECLPMWPFDHSSPACRNNDCSPKVVGGLLEMARFLGIEHGVFVGTKIPYIASLDLFLSIPTARERYTGISCKPREIYEKSERARERIAIDEAYCRSIGAHHVYEDGQNLDPLVISQLNWMRPLPSQLRLHRNTARLTDFSGIFNIYSAHMPIREAVAAAAHVTGKFPDAWLLFRLGVWLHLIDADLTKNIQTSKMIAVGGASAIKAWKAHYWGIK